MASPRAAASKKATSAKSGARKTAARRRTPSATTERTTKRPADWIARIRMYRQGLGDSFLVSFRTGSETRHILIDCGVLLGTTGGAARLRRVAENIAAETEGHLDALVGTHEHWDHVSGFIAARAIFETIEVNESWLAWTEDEADLDAKRLKENMRTRLRALQAAVTRFDTLREPMSHAMGAAVFDTLRFFGIEVGPGLLGLERTTKAGLDFIAEHGKTRFHWSPGDVIAPPWLPNIRIYVLGPPRDVARQGQLEGRVGGEMYELAAAEAGFYGALGASAGDSEPATPSDRDLPFERALQWRDVEAFKRKGRDWAQLMECYQTVEPWRRIDNDWLQTASRLAIDLDNKTNNTSLVLAMELIDSGKVLLFPADAQIGSWKSWSKLTWTVEDRPGEKRSVRAEDLLRRTVFYKVGHHGSHNATLKEGGLEAMSHPDLVAAIPVDEAFVKTVGERGWGGMPAKALVDRLLERTRGRVLRADTQWPTADSARPKELRDAEWRAFCESVVFDPGEDPIYVDYHI